MTVLRARQLLCKLHYTNGTFFSLITQKGVQPALVVDKPVKDSEGVWTPTKERPVMRVALARSISPLRLWLMSDRAFLRWVRSVLISLEVHEVDEWLRLGKTLLNDPHPIPKRLVRAFRKASKASNWRKRK